MGASSDGSTTAVCLSCRGCVCFTCCCKERSSSACFLVVMVLCSAHHARHSPLSFSAAVAKAPVVGCLEFSNARVLGVVE